jgi:hypothetical protein
MAVGVHGPARIAGKPDIATEHHCKLSGNKWERRKDRGLVGAPITFRRERHFLRKRISPRPQPGVE